MRARALAAPLVVFGLVGCGQPSADASNLADASALDAPRAPPADAASAVDRAVSDIVAEILKG